jgi:hypothetical protein
MGRAISIWALRAPWRQFWGPEFVWASSVCGWFPSAPGRLSHPPCRILGLRPPPRSGAQPGAATVTTGGPTWLSRCVASLGIPVFLWLRPAAKQLSLWAVHRYEALMIQGLSWQKITPATVAARYTNASLLDLAGNAFSGFALMPLLLAFMCSSGALPPFDTEQDTPTQPYAQHAFDFLGDTP